MRRQNEELFKKPHVFLGCSSEAKDIGTAIQYELRDTADVKVFHQGLFEPGNTVLETIMTFRFRFDFAIFLATPDDKTTSRKRRTVTPRDNVVFELGVMMGCLGPKKAIVVTAMKDLKLPSDLAGLTDVRLTPQETENTPQAMVATASYEIRAAIKRENQTATLGLLPSTALAIGYFQNFLAKMFGSLNDFNTEVLLKKTVPASKGKPAKEEFKKLKCDKAKVSFVVIIPDEPQDISHDFIGKHRVRLNQRMNQVVIKTATRDYPFYTYFKKHNDRIDTFFDLPTTLTTSFDAIDILLGKQIGNSEVIKAVKKREIDNFRKALFLQIKEKGWSNRVRFETHSYLEGLL